MRLGSLFAGIGGFDLAAESLGWSTAWVSEIDPFASAVLAKHFPHAPNLGDVTRVDWSTVERPNIICAGFPCQPHSLAGKRGASDDERDLWHECGRAVGVLRPDYFVGENVSGLLTSESGRFFNRVVSDLAALGYAVEWGTLSAAECGAPHQRSRIFIVAYPADDHGRRGERRVEARVGPHGERGRRLASGDGEFGDPDDTRREGRQPERAPGFGRSANAGRTLRLPDWSDAIPYRGADGTVRLIPKAALSGIEPEIRSLAHGLRSDVAGRDCGREVEAWPTPVVNLGRNATSGRQPDSKHHDGVTIHDAVREWPAGGSLWPVTESEPGRVAKLRAIGNAVVPAWVVAGPFARILELEAGVQ